LKYYYLEVILYNLRIVTDDEAKIDEKMKALKAAGKRRKSKSNSKQEASLVDQCELRSCRKRLKKKSPESPESQHSSDEKKKSRKNFKKTKGTVSICNDIIYKN